MKTAKGILLFCLSAVALVGVVILVGLAELKREIGNDRKRAQVAVTVTVSNIVRFYSGAPTLQAITNCAVAPATVQVLGTNPARFKVHAMTSWPDLMIYEYDSQTPERGIQHFLF